MERAREMRAAGCHYKQIADALGVAQTTVYRWLNPTYAEYERGACRDWKETHRGSCAKCGAPTNASSGTPSEHCHDCNTDIIAAMQRDRGRELGLRMLELRRQGMTNEQIASEVGVAPTSVWRSLNRLKAEGLDVPVSPWWQRGAA